MPDGSFNASLDLETVAETAGERRPPKREREVSTISFPYADLETAIETARIILRAGAVPLSRDQLASAMGQQAGSGNFSVKAGAARLFGLAETAAGKYQLTRLGFDILDADDDTRARAAMVKAFLSVPLYKRVYNEFRNGQLPPRPHGLENAFASFGVAAKQTDKARRAFENSARLAGLFEHDNDRLVEPMIGQIQRQADAIRQALGPISGDGPPRSPQPPQVTQDEPEPISAAAHPFIKGLLLSLPKLGETWAAPDRIKWLQAAAAGFDLMYKGGSPIRIDQRSEAPGAAVAFAMQRDPDTRRLLS